MTTPNKVAEIASAVGDPARAAMLTMLMDGRALTAAELANVAGIMPQTASTHLARLVTVNLIKVEKQGRHRYHRLANAGVARMLEGLMLHASSGAKKPLRTGPRDEAMRRARTCYDHLAGRLGVAITASLVERGCVEFSDDAGVLTDRGIRFLREAEIVVPPAPHGAAGRPVCRPCLDWSERRPHLAGQLGAAICRHGFDHGWLRRTENSRAVAITPKGHRELKRVFGIAE